MNDYYVYALVRPDETIFYIGKGEGLRIIAHEREARAGVKSIKCDTIREIWSQGESVQKVKLYKNLSSHDAIVYEKVLIDSKETRDEYRNDFLHRRATDGGAGQPVRRSLRCPNPSMRECGMRLHAMGCRHGVRPGASRCSCDDTKAGTVLE